MMAVLHSLVCLALFSYAHSKSVQVASEDGCEKLKNQATCDKSSACTWCTCAAVPSSCFTLADSKKLPPGVFVCDQKGQTTNSTAESTWFLSAPNPGALTFGTGVAFADETKGYIAGGSNGKGAEILRSDDGGKTFTNVDGIKFGADLLLLAAEASHNTVIVTSIFGELYSIDDGKTFHHSIGGGTSQSVRYIGPIGQGDGLHFGLAGQHGSKQGVAITNNGGISFKAYPAPVLTTDSRYAVYPSESTWYIAAGAFPSNPPPPPSPPSSSGRTQRYRKSDLMDEMGYFRPDAWDFTQKATIHGSSLQPPPTGYTAQIAKTVDGGKTWKSVFTANGTFYFNEIDCAPSDPDHCCAVGEASGESSAPGARIYCTTNGGDSWQRTYYEPSVSGKVAYSLMGLEFVSPSKVWACGGEIHGLFGTKPLFLYSPDAGQSWAPASPNGDLLGYVCLGFDMISETAGFAAVDNVAKQQAGLAKYSGGVPPPGPPPSPPPPPPPPSPPPPPGSHHYGDPNSGSCLSDEKPVQITGLSGSFCSPSCSSSQPCPTDVPDAAAARPKCILETAGSPTPTQCALICKPNELVQQCPDKASCKSIQGTGLCTYDN